MFIVRLPLKPYLQKYLSHVWGSEPIHLDKSLPIHREIFRSIQSFAKPLEAQDKKEYCKFLSITLTDKLVAQRRFEIDKKDVRRLNGLLSKLMYAEFYAFVNGRNTKTIESIYTFMDKYELTEDDIKSDTLKRSYHRYRQDFL